MSGQIIPFYEACSYIETKELIFENSRMRLLQPLNDKPKFYRANTT